MIREEAIDVLKHPDEMYQGTDGVVGYTFNPNRRNYEAFQLAIKALEQTIDKERMIEELEESLQKANTTNTKLILLVEGKQKPCEDCVSRKAALEQKPYEKFESVKDHICKLAGDYKCWDNRLTADEALELCHILEQEPCEDAISRKAVLNTLDFTDKFLDETRTVETYKELLIACYNDLPPVTPAHKTGRWLRKPIRNDKGGCVGAKMICTCCGKDNECGRKLNYCPNCGCFMSEGEKE